jgi:hypothetical protein
MKKGGANPPSVGTETETIMLGGKKVKFRKGALHKQLKVPLDEDIGNFNLRKIKRGEVGDMVRVKGKMFKITKLMKKRATFGLTLQGKK